MLGHIRRSIRYGGRNVRIPNYHRPLFEIAPMTRGTHNAHTASDSPRELPGPSLVPPCQRSLIIQRQQHRPHRDRHRERASGNGMENQPALHAITPQAAQPGGTPVCREATAKPMKLRNASGLTIHWT